MKLAFIFPGQGSQSVGMLKDLAEVYPQIQEYYDRASKVLGYDLWDIVQNNKEKLSQTEITQPALLTASYIIFKILEQEYPELKPEYMAGHSLGEYSALTCAGVLDFEDAVKLVQFRGNAMQNAVPDGGAMYAILGLDNQTIINCCNKIKAELNQEVSAVNFNCPGQVVIAGTKEATEKVATLLKEAGAKRVLPLAVSVPSHCILMKTAADAIYTQLHNINLHKAQVSVIHNFDLSCSSTNEEYIEALKNQLIYPVQWTQTIEKMVKLGVTHFIEIGPGKVLTGLLPRITKEAKVIEVNSITTLDKIKEWLA